MVREVTIQARIPFWNQLRGGGMQGGHSPSEGEDQPSALHCCHHGTVSCSLPPLLSSQQVSELWCPGKAQHFRGGGADWSSHSSDPRTCLRGLVTPRVWLLPIAYNLSAVTWDLTERDHSSASYWEPFLLHSASAQVWAGRDLDQPCILSSGHGEQGRKRIWGEPGSDLTRNLTQRQLLPRPHREPCPPIK